MNNYQYLNIFDKEGKLIQVEYALEGISSSLPVVIARNKDIIVCASKKIYKSVLLDETPSSVFKISKDVYCLITGLPADIDQIIYKLKNLCSSKEWNLGIPITPDILCRSLADKNQELMQSTGERTFCFSLALFGFDNNTPSVYYTDTSAIFYPYFGIGMGEKSKKSINFLEKNLSLELDNKELIEVVIQALMQSIGEDAGVNEIDVHVLERGLPVNKINDVELDALLQSIAEK